MLRQKMIIFINFNSNLNWWSHFEVELDNHFNLKLVLLWAQLTKIYPPLHGQRPNEFLVSMDVHSDVFHYR
jgi:hypothetical protein